LSYLITSSVSYVLLLPAPAFLVFLPAGKQLLHEPIVALAGQAQFVQPGFGGFSEIDAYAVPLWF